MFHTFEREKKKKFFLSKARSRFKKFNTGHEFTHAIDPLAKRATRAIKIKKKEGKGKNSVEYNRGVNQIEV